ncbi:MAG: hypothetical protein CEN89_268 [Candidatus Berkelbacteria bacterium Licking1014_7]|uniref:G5 domain-containing protein n=1 Tax=Candidatus Berkelbacteria bacterium Licking1014_7 TaxID=2017147 RepID=A0A554LJP6_9BACT|nr:MAG: hypothetical protein CEN89_268 [Candidatus Berkelbacteria bacterium Licking1014_7]
MKKRFKKITRILGFSLFSIILLFVFFMVALNVFFVDKIFPRVVLGQTNLSGYNKIEVKDLILQKVADQGEKIILTYSGKSWSIDFNEIGLKYDIQKTVDVVLSVGRQKNVFKSFVEQFHLMVASFDAQAVYEVDQQSFEQKIKEIASEIDVSEQDATLIYQNGGFVKKEEKMGKKFDTENAYQQLYQKMAQIDRMVYEMRVNTLKPRVYVSGLDQTYKKMNQFDSSDYILSVDGKKQFILPKEQIVSWFDFYATNQPALDGRGAELGARLSQEKLSAYIKTLALEIDREPINAKLAIKDSKVSVFTPSQAGLKLDQKKALLQIQQAILSGDNQKILLPVAKKEPEVSDKTADKLGIKEKIGQATTSFKGSPSNRVHNIKNGTEALTGILIKPGEVFSAVSWLGEVNANSGYLPELVIKENRTIPEYGGGLCQVSTTLFRAALNAGLPIKERQNHSYRVSYYEPPVGLDATIYLPKPDLKIENDTQGYILIQSEIKGDDLTFEFYGTSDGRTSKIEGPYVSDYTDPPEPIRIETDELKKGEEKQIEKAHKGASAVAYYRVFNQDGSLRGEQTFKSKYKSWAARFLVGTREEGGTDNGQ